jgi:hypothetical protein
MPTPIIQNWPDKAVLPNDTKLLTNDIPFYHARQSLLDGFLF